MRRARAAAAVKRDGGGTPAHPDRCRECGRGEEPVREWLAADLCADCEGIGELLAALAGGWR